MGFGPLPGGGIGGTTGTTDNGAIRADGTDGTKAQGSNVVISDPATGVITLSMVGANGLLITTNSNSDIVFAPDGSGNVNVKTTTGQMLFGSSSTGLGAIFNLDANIFGAGGRLYRIISGGSTTGPGGAWASQFLMRDETGTQNVVVYDGGNTGQLIFAPAGNTLALRNGTNGQTLIVSRTFTDTSNFSQFKTIVTGSVVAFTVSELGTGVGTLTGYTFDKSVTAPNIPVVDTGWTANADNGDKTAVIGSTATLDSIATALNLVTAGAGTQLENIAQKVKALEAALVAIKFPNA